MAHARAIWIVVSALLVIGALCTQLPKIELDTSAEGFLEEDDPARVAYNAFRDHYGRDEKVLVAVRPGRVFEEESLGKLAALAADIEAEVPKLQDVQSLLTARSTRGEADELIVEDLFETWPEDEAALATLEQRALANPFYRDLLLSQDGKLTTIVIETDAYSAQGEADDALAGFEEDGPAGEPHEVVYLTGQENEAIISAIDDVVARYEDDGFQIDVGGSPAMMVYMLRAMQHDMLLFTGLSILAIAAFLAALFRRVGCVLLPLLVSILSMLATLSTMALFGVPISMPGQILPSLLLAIGVGNSVHVLAIYQQARRRGEAPVDAIAHSLGHSGLAILMTNLTTAGGMASFMAAELGPVADFGVVAPLGVMCSFVLTMYMLPALIALFPGKGYEAERVGPDGAPPLMLTQRLLIALGDYGVRRAAFVVVSTALLLVIAGLGIARLKFSHDPLAWFPEGSSFQQSVQVLEAGIGGTMFVELIVDTGEESGLHDPAILRRLDEIRRVAGSLQVGDVRVGKTVSILDVVKEIHQALNEDRPEFYAIPDDRQLIAQELLLFENSGADDLEDLVDSSFSQARMTMQVPFVDAMQYEAFLTELDGRIETILGDSAEHHMTGLMAIMAATFNAVMRSMARSYVLAMLIITPLMVLLIGRVGIGLVSMVPNLTPIILTLGMMGWLGLKLDAFTLLVGSIALGLAVDDTIHFMHNFGRSYARGGDVASAVRETMTGTGQAMLFTSLVLSAGFAIFCFATLVNVQTFGAVTAICIVLAFLADAVLAPALMTLVAGREPVRDAALEAQRARAGTA